MDATTRTHAGTEIYNPFIRSTKSLSEVAYDGWNKTLEEALRRLLPSIPVPLGEGTLRAIADLPSPARFAMRFSLVRHGTIPDPRCRRTRSRSSARPSCGRAPPPSRSGAQM